MATPPKPPGRTLTTRDMSRKRDEAFAAMVSQLTTLARRPRHRQGLRAAWEWFDAEVQAELAAQGEGHPVHGRYSLHPGPQPRFLSAEELPYPWNGHAREFPAVYQHPLDAVESADRDVWERRFFAGDVHDLAADACSGLEEALALWARRLLARGQRRKVSTPDRLTRLNAMHDTGGPFDVVRGVLFEIVRATNRGVTWLTAVAAAVSPRAGRGEARRVAVFLTAVWLVQHHPEHLLVYEHLVTVLLAGRWDQTELLEKDSEPTKLVRETLRHEAERQAGRRLDEAALVAFLRAWR